MLNFCLQPEKRHTLRFFIVLIFFDITSSFHCVSKQKSRTVNKTFAMRQKKRFSYLTNHAPS